LVRNASDSSAVIVIATASAVPNSRRTATSPSGSRQISKGRDTVVPSCQAAFVFAPPMSTASVAGMRVVGVIDLKAGEAVHAVRGERERYRPLGDPLALASRYGLEELYVADLDAITGGAVQTEIIAALASEARVMVDAGANDPQRLLDLGVDRVVVGTETLTDADALPPDAVLSVDLRDRRVLSRDPQLAGLTALDAVARLAGPREVIVLDLARVGTGSGPDVETIAELHAAFPELELLAGGGVRDAGDLRALEDAGAAGALVATALHRGVIGPRELR
jgi:phosphoribosylformimino-5-aminoimidazole carboxamide ribotide isomerase